MQKRSSGSIIDSFYNHRHLTLLQMHLRKDAVHLVPTLVYEGKCRMKASAAGEDKDMLVDCG